MATVASPTVDGLVARGIAYALLAKMLGADPSGLLEPDSTDELREALSIAGSAKAAARLDGVRAVHATAAELAGRWVTWFDQGRIAPYECSHLPPMTAGHTTVLADVAGFYRAFGLAVHQERPDHVVAELEFASVVSLAEARALSEGDEDAAEVCARAARSFLRDHLGRWLDAWAARVGAEDALTPWAPYAAAAADLVATDAAQRHVIPVQALPVLPGDASLLPDEDPLPICGT